MRVPDALGILAEGVAAASRRLTTRDAVERHQNRLARRHLPWLLEHSPWTAQRFTDAGLTPRQWRELPPARKADMMANFDRLNTVGVALDDVLRLAREAERTRDFSAPLNTPRGPVTVGLSTGTSGSQGAFVVSREDRLRWAGAILAALFRPFPLSLRRPQRAAFFLRADGGLYRTAASRQVRIDFYDILRPIPELAGQLTSSSPTLIVGPPSVLLAVAAAGGLARPAKVVSVAEVLEDETRAALEEHFGAPVVQVYQATEGLLGLPCARGELHLTEQHIHVDAEPVTETLIRPVITDLRRRAQPIVRHRLTDLLELGDDCPCGSATRRIARIVGRQDDALHLPGTDGVVTVWPDFLRAALSRVPELREYRVVQTAGVGGQPILRVEIDPWRPDVRTAAARFVAEELAGHRVDLARVTLEECPWQPLPPGTKLRRVVRQASEE